MTTDFEKSFKAKLRTIAKEKNRDPADLWQALVLERFLVRLAQSPYQSHFILKGGVLLSKYITIGRETRDLDFLALNISNQISKLKLVFDEIVTIDCLDGFTFGDIAFNELVHLHMPYAGVEVEMTAHFGRVRFPVSIDVGFGDMVKPIKKEIHLTGYSKGPLFEKHVTLLCYPQEFIFAEKLETLVYRGALNSRMKDFHDLYSMISLQSLSNNGLGEIIRSVFDHRETPLSLPLAYNEEQITQLQTFWNSYIRNLSEQGSHTIPKDISHIIRMLNEWLVANTSIY